MYFEEEIPVQTFLKSFIALSCLAPVEHCIFEDFSF
jgi:hypothetical protein